MSTKINTKKLDENRERFIKIRQIENDLSEGKFDEFIYFIKNSKQGGLDYALEWAAYYGKLDLIKEVIRIGANVNSRNIAALRMACQNGHFKIVKYFLEETNINISSNNLPILDNAIEGEHIDIVKYLLSLKNENNEFLFNIHESFESALILAINKNNYEITKLLIENGADINVFNGYPLVLASKLGYLGIVKFLLTKIKYDKTIIEFAIDAAQKENHISIVEILQ